eukprot:1081081-Rhodomonas_salina.1
MIARVTHMLDCRRCTLKQALRGGAATRAAYTLPVEQTGPVSERSPRLCPRTGADSMEWAREIAQNLNS